MKTNVCSNLWHIWAILIYIYPHNWHSLKAWEIRSFQMVNMNKSRTFVLLCGYSCHLLWSFAISNQYQTFINFCFLNIAQGIGNSFVWITKKQKYKLNNTTEIQQLLPQFIFKCCWEVMTQFVLFSDNIFKPGQYWNNFQFVDFFHFPAKGLLKPSVYWHHTRPVIGKAQVDQKT